MNDLSQPNPEMQVDYCGEAGGLFGLAFTSALLTVLTLGIYRFWMKTKLRRYYWASIQPGGIPLEYTGTGMEKLLGFLIAVVILAVYLGIFNLAVSFIGLAVFQGNPLALNLTVLAAIPLIYYARYRSRGYILSRTRWRGLRFGLEPDAWKYTLNAIGHTLLTIVTLGVLFPRQRFNMEKFVTDRTWYGNLQMRQDGKWTMNMKAWLVVLAGLAFAVVTYAILIVKIIAATNNGSQPEGMGWLIFLIFSSYLVAGFAYVYFSVVSFRNMANNKVLGENIRFTSKIRTGKVTGIYVLGGIGITICAMIIGLIVFGVAAGIVYGLDLPMQEFGRNGGGLNTSAQWAALAIFGIGYLVLLLLVGVLAQVFIFQPILRHYATELVLRDLGELETASQRPQDSSVDAGGFADALDVGAAI